MSKKNIYRFVSLGVLLVIGLFSYFVLAGYFSNPSLYSGIIEYLDNKKNVVLSLAGSSATASAAITLLPGDVGSSIANSLANLSSKFLVVLTALYLEKYLLTIIAQVVFKIIIPLACGLVALFFLFGRRGFLDLGVKFCVLAVVLMLMVPSGVKTSQMVEDIYGASIQETIDNANNGALEVTDSEDTEVEESGNNVGNSNTTSGSSHSFSLFGGTSFTDVLSDIYSEIRNISNSIKESASNAVSSITEYVGNVPERVTLLLNKFIEATAVMIITSCVIPLLVVWLFLFMIKLLFGLSIDYSDGFNRLERLLSRKNV